ncbi:putative protein YfgD [anaerobic digester metagenome]|nr:hypothetical protein [Lentimicrobiaceae bacterium]
MTTVYHYPKCRKSRAGLQYVQSLDADVKVREYIREGIAVAELRDIVRMLGVAPFQLVRTTEDYYRENLKGKELSDEQWLNLLSEHPRLLRRPIVVNNGRAVVADPPEKAGEIIK